jgi:FdhE protein
MTLEAWVAKHPYLSALNDLQNVVEAAAAEGFIPAAGTPQWSDYLWDFCAGVPLLLSSAVAIDLQEVKTAFASFVEILASRPLPAKLGCEVGDLLTDLKSDIYFGERAVEWLIEKTTFVPRNPGLLHFLGWTITARYLERLVLAFDRWRQEESWMRNYCPTCGAPPAMAQLITNDTARLRLLSCGCCTTRWRYHRIGCPFCETADDHRWASLTIQGEELKIDHCETCGGYLKTSTGEGNENILLADWTSLHLDIIARDLGFRRYGSSLYRL